jgi:methanogenic corrinoid protein MtbC1
MLVKGGSFTREWAEKIGVDGYGRDAVEGIAEAKRLLGVDD